jgi:hypothetical protein
MTIRQNAVDSISMGVEDFQSSDAKRLVSSVRNFAAGLLLLLKHAMIQTAGDEAVIRQRVVPKLENGELIWEGDGRKTVDVQQIKDRCESLGIRLDWGKIDRLQNYRNEVEHYFSMVTPETVREYMAGTFILLHDLITNTLKEEPRDFLGGETWDFLVQQSDVFKAERQLRESLMGALTWPNDAAATLIIDSTCSECGSELLRPIANEPPNAELATFRCSACGDEADYTAVLQHAVDQALSYSRHDSGERFHICPECGEQGFDGSADQCVYCGDSGPYECMRCGSDIPAEELVQGGRMCGWCVHMSNKDD